MTIWLTSDTHFGHNKPFIWEKRGFSCVEEMNETLVANWNAVVKPDDLVWHLGDLMMGLPERSIEYVKRLNGHILMTRGNHDVGKLRRQLIEENVIYLCDYHWFELPNGTTIYMQHDPLDEVKQQADILLCGHVHSRFSVCSETGFINVGVDIWGNRPQTLETILREAPARQAKLENQWTAKQAEAIRLQSRLERQAIRVEDYGVKGEVK